MFHSTLDQLKSSMEQGQSDAKLRHEGIEERTGRLNTRVDETTALLEIQRGEIMSQNTWIKAFQDDIQANNVKLQAGFDRWHQSIKDEQNRQFEKLNNVDFDVS